METLGLGLTWDQVFLFWQMGEEERIPGTFTSQIVCHPFVAYLSRVMLSYVMLCMSANQILQEIHAVGSKTCLLSRQGEQQVEKQKTSWKKNYGTLEIFFIESDQKFRNKQQQIYSCRGPLITVESADVFLHFGNQLLIMMLLPIYI